MKVFAPRLAGATAAARIKSPGPAQVVQRFERALLVRLPEGPVILGTEEIEPGPLTLQFARNDWPELVAARSWFVAGGQLRADERLIDPGACAIWQASPWPDLRPDHLGRMVRALARFLDDHAPPDGLAPVITDLLRSSRMPADPRSLTVLLRMAGFERCAALHAWIRTGRGPPPLDLLGFGIGSTPSGDDVLGGALLLLAAGGFPRQAQLAAAVTAAAPRSTTALSVALLSEAAEGRAGHALVQVVAAVISGDHVTLAVAAEQAVRQGHSSGTDALAGVLLAAAAVTAAR